MANETIIPLGALAGPNTVRVLVDDNGKEIALNIAPDANNGLLKANGMAMYFYIVPSFVELFKNPESGNYDFSATIFKGLMTTEDTIGITDEMTESGAAAEGGGICTFSTTLALPESVIEKAAQKLRNKEYSEPTGFGLFAHLFNTEPSDPTPELGIVPILKNEVTIEVPKLSGIGKNFFIDAQGAGKGSIEAASVSSFLVTLNMMAAGAIIGSLKEGKSPFTFHYNLEQAWWMPKCDIHVDIDVDKVQTEVSGAFEGGGLLSNFALSAAYRSCITSGAIKTIIKMQGTDVPEDLKKMIDEQIVEMQKRAFDLVKSEIFDWKPTEDTPATAKKGLLGSLFGGSGVSLKANYQKRGVHLTQDFQIETTVTMLDTVSGTLSALGLAVQADPDKYISVVDIGDYFKKIQLAATNNINWDEKLSDGTDLSDPITSVQVQVAYPEYGEPLRPDGMPNLQTKAEGFHYTIGNKDPKKAGELAVWTKDNPKDVINIAFLRLENAIPEWDSDQLLVRKTIVFNASDPRVELSNKGSTFTREVKTKDHTPVINPDEVGYIFVKFAISPRLPKEGNITVTLICTIGNRTDTILVTNANQNNAIWQLYSDKYVDETSFNLGIQVEVVGPNFTDEPVRYGTTESVKVSLPSGRLKYVNPLPIALPTPTSEQAQKINEYIKAFTAVT